MYTKGYTIVEHGLLLVLWDEAEGYVSIYRYPEPVSNVVR